MSYYIMIYLGALDIPKENQNFHYLCKLLDFHYNFKLF